MIVLLIIFMVITPMLQKGVDVKLPTAGNTKERKDEAKTIIVAIRMDSTTYIGALKLDNPNDLVAQIKEIETANRPDVASVLTAGTGATAPGGHPTQMDGGALARLIPTLGSGLSKCGKAQGRGRTRRETVPWDRPPRGSAVFLKADQNLPYSEVMRIMDLCREAGVEEIALIAEKKVQG